MNFFWAQGAPGHTCSIELRQVKRKKSNELVTFGDRKEIWLSDPWNYKHYKHHFTTKALPGAIPDFICSTGPDHPDHPLTPRNKFVGKSIFWPQKKSSNWTP